MPEFTQNQKNKVIRYACGFLIANIEPEDVKESFILKGLGFEEVQDILLIIDDEIEIAKMVSFNPIRYEWICPVCEQHHLEAEKVKNIECSN